MEGWGSTSSRARTLLPQTHLRFTSGYADLVYEQSLEDPSVVGKPKAPEQNSEDRPAEDVV